MKKWPIALQVYSVREQAQADFPAAMKQLKQMGYDGVELAGLYGYTAVQVRAMLDEAGLELVCAHVPIEELEKDAVLDDYAAAGMHLIAIPWLEAPKDEAELAAVIQRIRSVAVRCKARGLQLLYHNHDFEFQKIADRYILEAYYGEIDGDLLQTELDTCWVNMGGEEPSAYLRKYTGRAPVVHLKDFVGGKSAHMYGLIGTESEGGSGEFDYRPVGYGVQDIPALLQAAEDAGCQWLIVEQDEPHQGKDRMECAEMSVKYLKTLIG